MKTDVYRLLAMPPTPSELTADDPRHEDAKHVAIARQLRHAIQSREFPVGSEMPSESSLVKQFDASRGTVRQALATLKQEGLIYTSRGRKPVVQAHSLAQSIDDFFSFSSWVHAAGHAPGQRTIELSRRRESTQPLVPLAYPVGEFLVHLTRLRLIDGEPTMIERTVFHDRVGQELMRFDTDSGSIYEHLITRGVPLDEGTHLIDAVAASALDAELLQVEPGSPMLRVRRNTVSATGEVLEYSEDRYRSDRASIRIRNSRATAHTVIRASHTTP